jgi:hypothetical protein
MERDLASSDPGLDALFRSFARRTRGYDLSWVEDIGRKRFWLFGRRRERKLTEWMKDWTAENRKDPRRPIRSCSGWASSSPSP